ncbi:HAAS signaling domain-containing protein [Nocardia australiensis]|uniref:HAAS signaling domain-containing protein n=1 Tax=Nocardia australiensis TaxID=2887191 RepID=UPI001D15586D|nr:hypothetical protein [Nocardia australiensis]
MSTPSLTERYVHEVVRRIPADQRTDVADELRATIADTVEAREGADPDAVEREVINEMGDPIRLAARYADRPLSLIGPDLYPVYIRLITMLLTIVLPIVVAALVVTTAIETEDIGKAIGAGIGSILTVGGQMIAWPTVIFALIDRSRDRDRTLADAKTWTVNNLPDRNLEKRNGFGDAIPTIVYNAFLIVALLLNFSWVPDGGDRVHVLDQSLWTFWLWPIVAGLAAIILTEIARIAKGRWTMPLACWHAAAQLLFAVPTLWILSQHRFFSDEFLTAIKSGSNVDLLYNAVAIGVVLVTANEIIKRFRDANAARISA